MTMRRIFNKLKKNRGLAEYIPDRMLNIFLNNYCNLSCFSCATLGMTTKPNPEETTLEQIESFLVNIEGYAPSCTILLKGGEVTMVEHNKLEMICEDIHSAGYKTAIITNAYKVLPVSWFDYIALDKHGVNDDSVRTYEKYLKEFKKDYIVLQKHRHRDIAYMREGNISKGARCGKWMKTLTLWKDIVYPCCNMMCIPWWNGETGDELSQSLQEAGWCADNPHLKLMLWNWRETLPPEIFKLCMLECWVDSKRVRYEPTTHARAQLQDSSRSEI